MVMAIETEGRELEVEAMFGNYRVFEFDASSPMEAALGLFSNIGIHCFAAIVIGI